jgi:hypothetical protein
MFQLIKNVTELPQVDRKLGRMKNNRQKAPASPDFCEKNYCYYSYSYKYTVEEVVKD